MIWELIFGFLVLVAASYVGTTMALRGFFGREYYDSPLNRQAADDGSERRTGERTAESEPSDTDSERP